MTQFGLPAVLGAEAYGVALQEFHARILRFRLALTWHGYTLLIEKMADVFISYHHVRPDQELASNLAEYLASHGVTHFLDTDLRIGEEWVKVIERELRGCKSFVVLLSSDSIRSDMVRQEIKLAYELRKQIFPVRVGYEGALPYDLGAYLDPLQSLPQAASCFLGWLGLT